MVDPLSSLPAESRRLALNDVVAGPSHRGSHSDSVTSFTWSLVCKLWKARFVSDLQIPHGFVLLILESLMVRLSKVINRTSGRLCQWRYSRSFKVNALGFLSYHFALLLLRTFRSFQLTSAAIMQANDIQLTRPTKGIFALFPLKNSWCRFTVDP